MSKTVEEVGLIAGGIALAVLTFGGGITFAGVALLSSTTASTLFAIGVSAAMAGVLMLLIPTAPITIQNGTLAVNDPVAARRVHYGHTAENAGVPSFADYPLGSGYFQNGSPNPNGGGGTSDNMDNQCLHLVYTLTTHEIVKFLQVWIDGIARNIVQSNPQNGDLYPGPDGYYEIYQSNPNSVTDPYFDGTYTHRSLIFFEFDTGNPANTSQPFPQLEAASSRWTSAMLQRGCAKVHVVFRYSACLASNPAMLSPAPTNPYSGSRLPRMQFEIIGKPLVDTRLSGTDSWKANTFFPFYPTPMCILDPNGNLQLLATAGDTQNGQVGLLTGGGTPAWNHTVGGYTADGGFAQAWLNFGPIPSAEVTASNPALAVYDYLTSTTYGMKASPATIDLSTVNAAANLCQAEQILLPNGATEYPYACDGMFEESENRGTVLKALCESMGGFYVQPGDQWRIYAGAWTPPFLSLTDADLRGPIKADFRFSRRDVCNTVRGKFFPNFLPIAPNSPWAHGTPVPLWQQTDFPPYQGDGLDGRPNWVAEDGGQVVYDDITLAFTVSIWMAQRLAKLWLQRKRFQVTLQLGCKLSAYQVQAGDTITFTHARWAALNPPAPTTYFIQQCTILMESGKKGEPTLGVDLVLRQTDPSIYSFGNAEYSPYNSTGQI